VGYGAPFAPDYRMGAVAAAGIQGLSVTQRSAAVGGKSTAFSPILALGVRASLHTGVFALWAGLDGCWRAQSLQFDEPEPMRLPRWFVAASLGALWLAAGAQP
jgi:hypothetical protein